jgi:hypothetical protein
MKYDDIINLEHPKLKHPRMSIYNRAAQFSPFAALTGYEDAVKETARLTDKKIIIDEETKVLLDTKLQYINSIIKEKPYITITYFIKDKLKNGGSYNTYSNNIKRIDKLKKELIFLDNKKISISDIIDIEY